MTLFQEFGIDKSKLCKDNKLDKLKLLQGFFFEWLIKTGFAVLTTYINFLFCGARRLAVR